MRKRGIRCGWYNQGSVKKQGTGKEGDKGGIYISGPQSRLLRRFCHPPDGALRLHEFLRLDDGQGCEGCLYRIRKLCGALEGSCVPEGAGQHTDHRRRLGSDCVCVFAVDRLGDLPDEGVGALGLPLHLLSSGCHRLRRCHRCLEMDFQQLLRRSELCRDEDRDPFKEHQLAGGFEVRAWLYHSDSADDIRRTADRPVCLRAWQC